MNVIGLLERQGIYLAVWENPYYNLPGVANVPEDSDPVEALHDRLQRHYNVPTVYANWRKVITKGDLLVCINQVDQFDGARVLVQPSEQLVSFRKVSDASKDSIRADLRWIIPLAIAGGL